MAAQARKPLRTTSRGDDRSALLAPVVRQLPGGSGSPRRGLGRRHPSRVWAGRLPGLQAEARRPGESRGPTLQGPAGSSWLAPTHPGLLGSHPAPASPSCSHSPLTFHPPTFLLLLLSHFLSFPIFPLPSSFSCHFHHVDQDQRQFCAEANEAEPAEHTPPPPPGPPSRAAPRPGGAPAICSHGPIFL